MHFNLNVYLEFIESKIFGLMKRLFVRYLKMRRISQEAARRLEMHEAGHATAAIIRGLHVNCGYVSYRGYGAVFTGVRRDNEDDMFSLLIVYASGEVAERLHWGYGLEEGLGDDRAKLDSLAREYVTRGGLIADAQDAQNAVMKLKAEIYRQSEDLLRRENELLVAIAEAYRLKTYLEGHDFRALRTAHALRRR